MTLPVSSYEELLAQVRSLTHETIQLQRELTTPVVDYNDNGDLSTGIPARTHKAFCPATAGERPLITSACCDVIGTCDNKKRGVASAGWTTPTAGTHHHLHHQAGTASGEGTLHRQLGTTAHRRSVSASADEGASSAAGAGARALGWNRKGTLSSRTNTLQLHNGSIGNEDLSAASVLARLGVTVDAHGGLVRERPASLLSGRIGINNKENVMDEPKEEDEKKTADVCRTKNDEDSNSSEEDGGSGGAVGDSKMTSSGTQTQQVAESTEPPNLSALYHGTWPVERTLWHSGPSSIGGTSGSKSVTQDVSSVMSFTSSMGLLPDEVAATRRTYSQQQLGAKVEMVYSLLSMLGTHDREDMSRTLLAMSSSPDSCVAMRQSGCLPLLVQLLHSPDSDTDTRQRASQVLHNMVHSHPDDKRGRREARVLRLLEQVREYCDSLRERINAATPAVDGQDRQQHVLQAATRIDQEMLLLVLRANEKELGLAGQDSSCSVVLDDMERHPGPTIAALMKLSFDEEHRHAMCQLGGLHAVAELIQIDHEAHGSTTSDQYCVTLRRYAGMALTNLTFGDGANKALLCSFRQFMKALVAQLKSPSEDLRQVTASVLRNLSWRADGASKQTLREVGAVSGLMQAAMEGKKESTLKSILSALWNLSAHCSINKVDICAVDGALGFLVDMLSYDAPSKSHAIVENAGGILRNISSHIAVREDYRAILRKHGCLQVLLQQLKSPSLTVVSNACGTLWNLSARCAEDQRVLWDMGAVSMLRSLVHSKHKMICMGSSAALKNLLSAKPNNNFPPLDSTAKGLGLPALPSLYVRKQRALEQELDQTLSETCDNIEPSTSPSASTVGLRDEKFIFSTTERSFGSSERRHGRMYNSYSKYHSRGSVARSDSRDSVTSTLSDSVYERVSRNVVNPLTYGQVSPTNGISQGLTGSLSDSGRINSRMSGGENSDRKFLRRYCNSMKESRDALPLDVRNEENPQQSVSQHSHELYQHARLGQISETNVSGPSENQMNAITLSKDSHVGPQQSSRENQHSAKTADKREEDCHNDRVGGTIHLDPSLTKQPKNLFCDSMRSSNQRASFGPLVAGSYGKSSNKPQYHHSTQQQNCIALSSYTAVRPKYSDFPYDDDTEAQELPVDYSLKYVEDNPQPRDMEVAATESNHMKIEGDQEGDAAEAYQSSRNGVRGKQNQNDLGCGYPYRHQGSIHVSKNMKMNVVYGDYAETDLDQPTDYSLKYAEENDETEFEKNHEMSSEQERDYYDGNDPIHEDTLKTYCTEGTPYETPYNFSTATSMSDLHCEPPMPHSEDGGGKKQPEQYTRHGSVEGNVTKSVDENETSISEDVSNFDKDFTEKGPQMKALPPAPRQPLKRLQSGLSSGLLSPEKPVQYCEEGTPGCFSRVSSLSSLSSVPAIVDSALEVSIAAHTDHTVSEPDQKLRDADIAKGDACSLAEESDKGAVKREVNSSTDVGDEAGGRTEDMKEEQQRGDREGKVVTFGGADHYAEETPLMFSRCSSLGSLSSIEQHSIHDDRSSVISDFSRRTSGIVSPSELPDSPTQTVPASPRHTKAPVEFPSRTMEEGTQPVPANRHQVAGHSGAVKGSVFEDNVVAFKEEDTPVEFSRATSLSSLTIDDEPKISNDAMLKEVVGRPSSHARSSNFPAGIHHVVRLELVGTEREDGMEKQDVEKEKRGELADCCELAPVSEGEEENDEDMLAACINVGMQNSRLRQCQYSCQNTSKTAPVRPTNVSRFQASPVQSPGLRSGRPSGIPVKTTANSSSRQAKVMQLKQQEGATGTVVKPLNYMVVPGGACEDAVQTYCTEGTPANISHAGSHSDLSVLSLVGDGDETEAQKEEARLEGVNEVEEPDGEVERPELSDDSSNFSGDNDNILAECIQSGMPKARQAIRRIVAQPASVSNSSSSELPSQPQKKIPTVVPGVTVSVLPTHHPVATTYKPPSHHLCGLSHSSPHSTNKKPSVLPCSPRPKAADQRKLAAQDETGKSQNLRTPKSKFSGTLQGSNVLPHCLPARDEVETYATEGSPSTFSIRSSLSDLTVNSSDGCAASLQRSPYQHPLPGETARDIPIGFNAEDTSLEVSLAASLSPLRVTEEDDDVQPSTSAHQNTGTSQSSGLHAPITCSLDPGPRSCVSPLNRSVDSATADATAHLMVASDGSWADHSDKHDDSASSKLLNKTSSVSEDIVTVLSRNGSLSSLSVDSFGSVEPTPSEQALLEQCISSGMPKSKSEIGCGKARLPLPVSTKKMVGASVCKIPLATDHRILGDGERQGPVIPSVPVQKLELKPVVRTHSESSTDAMRTIESGMACLYVQDVPTDTCSYDIRHVPKNGLDPSAAFNLKKSAADVYESIAAIEGVQDLQDHLKNTSDLPENMGVTEEDSSCVSSHGTLSAHAGDKKDALEDPVECHLHLQYEDDKNDENVFRRPAVPEECQCRPDMKLEICKKSSCISSLGNKTISPRENVSDIKSQFSSGESSSTGVGTDEKVEDCQGKGQRDPDAMVASLDRFTEETVQQTQDVHLQKDKNKDSSIMKQSLIGSDTWNEDTSPNDISFPSMSLSAPLVASFRSDNHEDGAITLPELAEECDISKTSEEQQGSSLTDTHMIQAEAGRLAEAVQTEGQNFLYASSEEMKHSLTSLNSIDLDAIKPPSMMGSLVSLTASLSGQLDNVESGETREHCNSSSLPPHQPRSNGTRLECRHSRKRSLPAGMMVRRALGNSNHSASIENLQDNTSVSSSCNSHLDNIKPPSAMEELIDIVDMENSMISVASITSEVADTSAKEHSTSEQLPGNSDGIFELLKPAASVMAEVCAAAMCASVRTNSASDCLDNINPPSAFSEFGDLADPQSTAEPGTETICSDTEMCTEEPGYAHSMDKLDEVDAPDLPSDTSMKTTPLPSADQYMTSSAESTPKKHRQLTPKQKRQMVKERYRTYTITGEDGQEEEIHSKKGDDAKLLSSQPEISLQVGEADSVKGPLLEEERSQNKTTPKHRRLEDRQRFQTRVLDKSASVDTSEREQEGCGKADGDPCQEEHPPESINTDTMKERRSRIKTLKQKRAEAKERFQTRTLSEEIKPQPETNISNYNAGSISVVNCSDAGFVEAPLNVTPEEIESLLERDANIVITTLNDSRRCNSESSELPSSDEMLLECETLSLISIESESDQNSNICRVGRRRGSDLIGREPSVSEEPGMSNTGASEERVNEVVEADVKCMESVDNDGEESQGEQDNNADDLPKTRGPRIVKPEERLKLDENAESNCTDDGTPQNNSPKSIRGRRKALYSSPAVKRPSVPSSGLPVAGKARSSIPVVSVAASNGRPTRASVVRQTGKGTSQRSVSRTPPSSTERSPRNASPKTSRTGRTQQRNPNNVKLMTSRNSGATCTPGKESDEQVVKDPRFKPPERQGTFTKDEIPKVLLPPSPTKTRIPVPASISTVSAKYESEAKKTCGVTKQSRSVASTTSKIKIHKEKSAPVLTRSLGQSRFTRNYSQEISNSGKGLPTPNQKSVIKAATIPGRNGTTRSPPLSRVGYKRGSIGAQEGMKASLSNQSLQSNDSGRITVKQGGVQPQRSTSNCSLNSVASGGGSGSKKEVTSKIASLWKRVEESKTKQKAAAKDSRVWITAAPDEAVDVGSVVSADVPQAARLVRSSTFEGLPPVSASNDEVDHNARIATASKTTIKMRFSKHDGKRESKDRQISGDFTGFVANQEAPLKPSTVQRQVAEVTGVAIVQPTRKVMATSEPQHLNNSQDEIPTPEVVLRRRQSGSENTDPDLEKPKRLSRLGSFIRIDPPEEVISSGDSRSLPRHPASAIVEPFNYCPPTSMGGSHTVTPVAKRSESYLSLIGNVEELRREQTEVLDEHMPEFNTASIRITTV
ncbi:uncharacterized protein LOC111871273 isoform X3 [Cryptotermes secundus]|nr:uncharacterized protein LOC111871273 isoform X3 [Cryptotermes secundus]